MAMQISQDGAIGALGSLNLGRFRDCIERAWAKFDASVSPIVPLCTRRGRASIFHDFVCQEIRDEFSNEPNFEILDNTMNSRFLLLLHGVAVIQFKKLNKDFTTTNYPTPSAIAFDEQQEIEEFPPLPRLTVGYHFGQYETSLEGIWLAFVHGRECVWHFDLRTGEGSLVLELPIGPNPSVAPRVIEFPRRAGASAAAEERASDEKQKRRQRRSQKAAGSQLPPMTESEGPPSA